MSTVLWGYQSHIRIAMLSEIRITGRREERIIAGVNDPDRQTDGAKITIATALIPIVLRVTEAMQRRGIATIKIAKSL